MFAVGKADQDFDVELIEAMAELLPVGTLPPGAFADKYAQLSHRAGFPMARFAATYSQAIRIRPTRWLGWGGLTLRRGAAAVGA